MAIPYEQIVEQDLNLGYGKVTVIMPAGGTAQGDQIGTHTFVGGSFNPVSFGAIGDGVADDTAALQAALDAAALVGGEVVLPAGIFLTDPLTWPLNVTIRGMMPSHASTSWVGSVLRARSAGTLLTTSDTAVNYQHGRLRDLCLDGASVGTNGLLVQNAAWMLAENLYITGFTGTGLQVRGGLSCEYHHCFFMSNAIGVDGDLDAGLALSYPHWVTFRNCVISNNSTYGLQWQRSCALSLLGCDIENNGTAGNAATGGIKVGLMDPVGAGVALTMHHCWVEYNHGHSAIRVDPPFLASGGWVMLRDCQVFSGTRSYGLALMGAAGNGIRYFAEGCTFQNAATKDIFEADNTVVGMLLRCGASTASFNADSSVTGEITTALPSPTVAPYPTCVHGGARHNFDTVGGQTALQIDQDNTAGGTRLNVWDNTAAALARVSIGAPDSGGAGYRALRIPN